MSRSCFLCWSIFAYLAATVNGNCVIRTLESKPLFIKLFGSRRIILNKSVGDIHLSHGETIYAYCPGDIRVNDYNGYRNTVGGRMLFFCDDEDYIVYTTVDDAQNPDKEYRSQGNTADIYCTDPGEPLLYEGERPLTHCENFKTLAIGILARSSYESIIASLCYDFDNVSLRFVNYLAYRSKFELIPTQNNIEAPHPVGLGAGIGDWKLYFNPMSESTFINSYEKQLSTHEVLKLFNFDFESLIQDTPILVNLAELNNLFNIIWWRNLREGNWRFYLDALKERTKHIKYDVYMGISGKVAVPMATRNGSETLTIVDDEMTVTAPKYIWSYLRSLDPNVCEEFVVVAHNSPFDNESAAGIIFCNDICDQIQWLKASLFGRVRLLPTMGTVFCCRPEEVQSKMTSFPYARKTNEASTPATPVEANYVFA